LYEILTSKLYVEERSTESVVQAIEGVQLMLKQELCALESEAGSKRVKTLGLLNHTLAGLIKSLIEELKRSRDDMRRSLDENEGIVHIQDERHMEFDRLSDDEERKLSSGEEINSEYSGGNTDTDLPEFNESDENEIFHDSQDKIVKVEEVKAETS
jgi:hypothetical protein